MSSGQHADGRHEAPVPSIDVDHTHALLTMDTYTCLDWEYIVLITVE